LLKKSMWSKPVPESATRAPVSESPSLVRDLTVAQATAVVVGTVIGSGIFRVPGAMMRDVGSADLVFLAWIVGGLLSFFGALTYAELGAMKPQAGGDYVYVRDAYGPMFGFLNAWTWLLVAKPASVATVATGLTDALSALTSFAFLADPVPALRAVTWAQVVAISVVLAITTLNYIGIKRAGVFQLVFTSLKIGLMLAIAIIGFTYSGGSWANFGTHYDGAVSGFTGFMLALVATLWAYDGWADLNQVAGEVRNPGRSIPVALIAGLGIVAALYILMNAAVQYVLPAAVVAASKSPAATMAAVALGAGGGALITAGIALSMVVTMNGTVMSGGRIPYAVARDGYFFQTLAKVHPRFRTPGNALILQAVLSILLLMAAASFKNLLELAIFGEWIFYMLAAGSVFYFRFREPNAPRPYKVWGYPVVPALFIISAAVVLYHSFADNLRVPLFPGLSTAWWNSIAVVGLGLIVAGVPVFWLFARRRAS
jgi:basic amino acid/polyamine antiporter, APA family